MDRAVGILIAAFGLWAIVALIVSAMGGPCLSPRENAIVCSFKWR
jgi:hypothetical protein